MKAPDLLSEVRAAVERKPVLLQYTVIVMGIRDLERGDWWAAMGRFLTDLDKIRPTDKRLGEVIYQEWDLVRAVRELEDLQTRVNGGRGSKVNGYIIEDLKKGDFETARTVYGNEGDKVRQYPELDEALRKHLGCRVHGVKHCTHKWCS